jgi:hypothetical protein
MFYKLGGIAALVAALAAQASAAGMASASTTLGLSSTARRPS